MKGGDSTQIKNAGLPNITGQIPNYIGSQSPGAHGAIFLTDNGPSGLPQTGGTFYNLMSLSFDASDSNSIFGTSTTVQPPALQLLPQIKF